MTLRELREWLGFQLGGLNDEQYAGAMKSMILDAKEQMRDVALGETLMARVTRYTLGLCRYSDPTPICRRPRSPLRHQDR